MKPSRVSAELRRIAAGIDRCSTRVRRDLVSRDLRRVLSAMGGGRDIRRVLAGMEHSSDTTVYHVRTEGRGYTPERWEADKAFIESKFPGPLYVMDTEDGIMFSESPVSRGDLFELVGMRGGQQTWSESMPSDEDTNTAIEAYGEGLGSWKRYDSADAFFAEQDAQLGEW
jgi:hypothetical protein